MSSEMAWRAASFTSGAAEKSGKPWAMFTASYCIARRVISRITDSVNRSALADSVRCTAAAIWLEPAVDASPALNGLLPHPLGEVQPAPQCARPYSSQAPSRARARAPEEQPLEALCRTRDD